jgi:hypothetical protein
VVLYRLEENRTMDKSQKAKYRGELIWGILLILAGGVFLLSNFDILEIDALWNHWPLIFVLVGLFKLTAVRSIKDIGPPMWWVFIGSWLYVSVFEIFGLGFSRSWPILIIAWGVSTLWNVFTKESRHIWD